MADPSPADNPRTAAILAVTICALLIRVGFLVVTADSLDADPDAYRAIAENLRQNGVFGSTSSPTAFRPPLYPILLAAVGVGGKVSPLAVGGLHVLFGVSTVVLSFLLARQWRFGRWSFVAAALVALDPILLNQSSLVMTETLATLLATIGLYVLSWWSAKPSFAGAMLAGIAVGLACLCRPTFIPWLGLTALGIGLQRHRARESAGTSTHWRAVGQPVVFLLTATLVISPWMLRNFYVLGVAKATTTHGGYTVLLGNNPSFYRYLREAPRGTTWDSTALAEVWAMRRYSASPDDPMWTPPYVIPDLSGITPINRSEPEDDKFAYSLARRYVAEEPGMFFVSCLARVSRLWQVTPYRTNEGESTARMLMRIAIGCWYCILFVLAILALIDKRSEAFRSPLVWGLLLCFTFTAVHMLYWSNMRMRAPLMPFLCLLAARGAACLSKRTSDRKP